MRCEQVLSGSQMRAEHREKFRVGERRVAGGHLLDLTCGGPLLTSLEAADAYFARFLRYYSRHELTLCTYLSIHTRYQPRKMTPT